MAFHEVGNVVFPVRRYNVELAVGVRNRNYSPFDDFFGFDSPFMERQRIIQKKCASENLKMKVVKRPPKTMHDIERGGAVCGAKRQKQILQLAFVDVFFVLFAKNS